MKTELIVKIKLKYPVSHTEIASYVRDALLSWDGSLRPPSSYEAGDPGDPMFDNVKQVTVKRR